MHLQQGWNIISNPTPIPLADRDIVLDSSLVSYFHALEWEGSGESAQPFWSQSDTLKPFHGYAVHAEASTRLIIDPIAAALKKNSAPKIGNTTRSLKIIFSYASGRKGSLSIQEGRPLRPSPAIPFFREGLRASWNDASESTTLPVTDLAQLDHAFSIYATESGSLNISSTPGAGILSGRLLAIWNPAQAQLSSLEAETQLPLIKGNNTFRVMALPVESFLEKQQELQAGRVFSFSLAPNAPNPFSRQTLITFSIPHGEGPYQTVTLEILDLNGKSVYQRRWQNIAPGMHSLLLHTERWTSGRYISRLTGRSPSGSLVLQRPMLHLKDLP